MLIDGPDLVIETESDVEQKIIWPLLTDRLFLNIPVASVYTKPYLAPAVIDKTAGRATGYYPDYSVWTHGLPLMIVEAKAPDVPSETGYREASLYARHLNQQYPADFNPCRYILATNGTTLLSGTWDSKPDLCLSREDLRLGAAGLESLKSRYAGPLLDELGRALSAKVRSRHVYLPADFIGGQPVLRSKRPFNSFAADLSPILRRYFSSSPQENIHEIARRAYVSSDETTEYDRILESLLKDRLSLKRDTIVTPLEPRRHGEQHVARAISAFDKDRPEHGQLQIIQGSVGAGKSLFIRRYKDVLQPSGDAARTRWSFIDFNTSGSMADSSAAERWLYQTFVENFQSENGELDLASNAVLRGIFSRNLQRRRGIYEELERVSAERAAELRAQDLAAWQDDPRELTRGIADYVLGSRHDILVVVMDNVDRLDLASQLNAFQLALGFMALTKCFVILQMRDETYERFKDKRPLDTYRAGITFHISPPRFVDVVKRRLELSLEYLTENAEEVQRYTLESGVRITFPKSNLGVFLRELYLELFERRHNISRVLEALAGRDVRKALEMFVSVITSGHLSETAITSNVMGRGAIPIREHNILKILMRTDYRFASEHSGYIVNMFRFEREWERPDNFILIEILYYLTVNRKRKGQIGLEGYFTCRGVANELQRFGYVPEDVLEAANYLLRRQLIAADHMNFASVAFEDSVRILASGFMHLRILSERLEYLYGTVATVPLSDEAGAARLSEYLQRENVNGVVRAGDKIRAVRLLYKYLRIEKERVRKHSPFDMKKADGASYVLAKISDCLCHCRPGGRSSEATDPLDV